MARLQVQWDDPTILEHNRQRLLQELSRLLRAYEARYHILSSELETALLAGKLTETAEVCDWLIAYHTYLAVE